jgi:hypothetical protein
MPESEHKAKIMRVDSPKDTITCLFNPNEYTFRKQNTWTLGEAKGKNVPDLEFGGGQAMSLDMQLFFDTTATGEDVRDITNKIWKLMMIDENLTDMTVSSVAARPPLVEFHWGDVWSFTAVITDIRERFTMFDIDGKPVRATLDVTFLQAKEEGKYPGQNPTTVGKPGYRRRVVREGETLDWIAHEEYGDAAMWRFIAETNNVDNPRRLRPGQILAIAPSR